MDDVYIIDSVTPAPHGGHSATEKLPKLLSGYSGQYHVTLSGPMGWTIDVELHWAPEKLLGLCLDQLT